MSPTKPTQVIVLEEVADGHYASLEDPSAPEAWPIAILKHLTLLAGNTRNQDHFAAILANALAVQTIPNRQAFLNKYSVPGNVQAFLADLPAWPDVRDMETWPESTPEDLSEYRSRLDQSLVAHGEAQARRIIKMGARQSMAYLQKFWEAKEWMGLSASKKSAADEENDYPHIHGYSVIHAMTMDAAANVILAKGRPWNKANAAIEDQRELYQKNSETMATHAEVKAEFDTRKASMTGIIDLLDV
jgi:hypothetical protein